MKTSLSIAILLAGISFAHAVTPTPSLAPPSDNPGAPISPTSLPAAAVSTTSPASVPAATSPAADAPASTNLPSANYAPGRYEALWVKSPFAVATSETVGEESPDYYLVGVANQDGVFFASVIERQNQEHFLLTSDRPVRGLTLKSINRSKDGVNTYAEVVKDGQPLTLKMEVPPAGAAGGPTAANMAPGAVPFPHTMAPQIPMPGGTAAFPNNGSARPFTRFHRPPIRLPAGAPPSPGAAPAPTVAPAGNQPPPPNPP